ncbi:Uncharacterized protein ABJ99_5253 [Pseudomonas syringae pv. cilantro]|uniref:Uncharacterized protein n=2 Tax=Pseudomonas syringae group TaxID=136849 RepID=A0A0N0GC94_PSESX|nr:Uncharacterized protein ABJ99_5253 [Pseudomonas syringae pv. cilantro]KPW70667.1 Uncharacterized protein ALO76_04232 [Pseudomonas syringae pv. coriandricola]RMN10501.1 hypothetical protein ALQ65_01092 [Pseudomonas syringae pv. coriandricola]
MTAKCYVLDGQIDGLIKDDVANRGRTRKVFPYPYLAEYDHKGSSKRASSYLSGHMRPLNAIRPVIIFSSFLTWPAKQ